MHYGRKMQFILKNAIFKGNDPISSFVVTDFGMTIKHGTTQWGPMSRGNYPDNFNMLAALLPWLPNKIVARVLKIWGFPRK